MTGDRKNPLHPQPAPNRRDRVRERTSRLPGQSTTRTRVYRAGNSAYNNATTVYMPNRHGATRSTVFRLQPRVVSTLKTSLGTRGPLEMSSRCSSAGIGLDYPRYRHRQIGGEQIRVTMGPGQVVDEYPKNRYQRRATLYRWPVLLTTSTLRRPPPYQETFSFFRWAVAATTA